MKTISLAGSYGFSIKSMVAKVATAVLNHSTGLAITGGVSSFVGCLIDSTPLLLGGVVLFFSILALEEKKGGGAE